MNAAALPGCLRAFEKSDFPEDLRDLMQPFLLRRTRVSGPEVNPPSSDLRPRHGFLSPHSSVLSPLLTNVAARNLFDSDTTQLT